MAIIYSDDSGQVQWPITDSHDPNSKKYYYIDYRPPTRINSKAYIKDLDLVIPTTFNGCMYQCISGGISALIEGVFTTVEGGGVIDGDVKWKTLPYSAKLSVGDVITTSTWAASTGVVITDNTLLIEGITTGCRVDSVLPTLKKFTLTNHITIQRVSGRIEEFEKSLVVPVKEL